MPLNAYALDFFKHGSAKVIEKENGSVTKSQMYCKSAPVKEARRHLDRGEVGF